MRRTLLRVIAWREEHTVRPMLRQLVVALVLAALVAPAAASAQSRSSQDIARELERAEAEESQLRSERDRRAARVAAAEEELAAIGARLDDARARLRVAEGQVALAEAGLVEAEHARDEAESDRLLAEAALERAQRRLEAEEGRLADQVIAAYKYGSAGTRQGTMAFEVLRQAQSPNDLAIGVKQLQVVIDTQEATVESVNALREEREQLADVAVRAFRGAQQAADDAAEQLAVTEELRADAAAVADEIRRDEAQHTAVLVQLRADVQATDASLRRIDARQRELTRELQRRRAAEEEARRAAAVQVRGGGGAGGPPHGGVCPVVGAVAGRDFSDDWGYPRPGGRSHQGNDIFASRGTPVVAIDSGVVVRTNPADQQTGLGGITVTYRTGDGSEWYNAHLDSIAPGVVPGAAVGRGQQIGTVGNTGNARTTPPHLHLGRKYNGTWVNPYPTVAPLCR